MAAVLAALGIGSDRPLLELHLAPFGKEMELAASIEEALAAIARRRIDLVLLDASSIGSELSVVLALIAAPDRALVVLAADPPSPIAMLEANALWLPRSARPEDTGAALLALAERASVQRENAEAVSTLDARLRALREWADSARRAIDELLHELKTPIFVVQGFSANLLDGIGEPLLEGQRAAVERIHAAAKLMGDVAKGAAPKLDPPPVSLDGARSARPRGNRTQLDPVALAEGALALFSQQGEERRVSLELEKGRSIPLIWGERSRLLQLLVNLLANAMRFVPDGGRIRIELSSASGHVEIIVADSGPGIDPAFRDRIFDPGVSGQGRTGLGLAIASEIAAEHKGLLSLDAKSPLGGAAFRLSLPIDARAIDRRIEILLVDDPVLAGQLLIELRNRCGAHLPASRPTDMEKLAARIVEQRSSVVFAGTIEERLGTQTIDLVPELAPE